MKAQKQALDELKALAMKALAKRMATKMNTKHNPDVVEEMHPEEGESMEEHAGEDQADEISEGVGDEKTQSAEMAMKGGSHGLGLSPEESEKLKKYLEENC